MKMKTISSMLLMLGLQAQAGEPQTETEVIPSAESEFFRIDPTLHLRMAHGYNNLPEGIDIGGHDPRSDGFNLQGFEMGANVYAGDYVSGFATANIFKRNGEDFEGEFEEGFLKLHNLPYGFELRGGRMLARLGDQNSRHLHAWDFVDANMTTPRMLGEDGFAYDGGEISWLLPTSFDDIFSIGFGAAVSHDHDHGGHDEDHDDDHDDHDDDHFEEGMDRPDRNIVSARYQAQLGPNDFHQFQSGVSFLTGENGFDEDSRLYGVDLTYTWRENGYESGGKQLRWRNEWIYREVETGHKTISENGFNTALLYEFIPTWEAGVRYGYVEGAPELALTERHRISPVLTKRFNLADELTGIVRLQYNYDDMDDYGDEHSVWLQFGFDWGPGEVR